MEKNINMKTSEKKKFLKMSWVRAIFLAILVVVFASLAIWNSWLNTKPVLNVITVRENNLPADFNGYRIAQVSDFHCAENMKDAVLEQLREAQPDIICVTGDLIDSRNTKLDVALELMEQAMEIAQCYFVTGNHENAVSSDVLDALLEGMAERGVILLEYDLLQRNSSEIAILGNFHGNAEEEEFMTDYEGYKIMLSHYPETVDYYVNAKFDLVLAGHAHGGLLRLPFIGGIYAPGQGFFPKYDAGLYTEGTTSIVVNRGIGNSGALFRFNNQPEVVLIELCCE